MNVLIVSDLPEPYHFFPLTINFATRDISGWNRNMVLNGGQIVADPADTADTADPIMSVGYMKVDNLTSNVPTFSLGNLEVNVSL